MQHRHFIPVVLAALLAGACVFPGAARADEITFDDAIAAFNYGDNDQANRYFWKLAGEGDPRAEYYLAYMLDAGLGSGKDVSGAAGWYRKSADQDYLPAVVYMGYIYSTGHGVQRDDKEAFKWYTRAAQMGDAIAQNNLATMLRMGKPYAKNLPLAAQWFLQSALQGNMRAQYNLATMYRIGDGIPKNEAEAVKWYTYAANQGDMYAQNALGYMYRKGIGVTADPQMAIDWYRRAAEQGHVPSQMAIALMYEYGEAGTDKGINEAVTWYFNAAKQGNERAMHRLGYLYERGPDLTEGPTKGSGLPLDYKEAFKWYKMAADKNYAPSIAALANLYETGHGVKADPTQAFKLYQQAANLNYPLAQLSLAAMYRDGVSGTPKDPLQAFQWYAIASKQLRARLGAAAQTSAEGAPAAESTGPDNEMLGEATRNMADLSRTITQQDRYNATAKADMWKPYDPDAGKTPGSPKDQPLFYDQ